jgi:hypothetical protein
MKKQLLILSFAFLGAGYLMAATEADSAWSATDTTVTKLTTTIKKCDCAATIDGKITEEVWSKITAVPVARPMIHEIPSLWSAYFKAFWNDTAIFVLGVAVDDNFWPSWKSKAADWASDKFETYFDANGTTTSTTYGASDAGAHGFYQVTANYDTIPAMGHPHAGSFAGTIEGNTWQFSSGLLKHDSLIVEWCVPFKTLKDSNATQVTPTNNYTIGFDCDFVDLDSATAADRGRTRQMWSNTNAGGLGEDWGNMSDAGLITFSTADVLATVAVHNVTTGTTALVLPTITTGIVTIQGADLNASIYNTLGQKVLVSNNTNTIDLSVLNNGIYIVKIGLNSTKVIVSK